VPVYLKDTVEDELPMRAIVQGKPESEWREIDDSYRFVFSLHLNDPIRLVRKSGVHLSQWGATSKAWIAHPPASTLRHMTPHGRSTAKV